MKGTQVLSLFVDNRIMVRLRTSVAMVLVGMVFGAMPLPAAPEPAKKPIIFLLDASGSMLEMFQGVPRIVAARVMLEEQLSRLPPGTATGLVAFGNGIEGCESVRLYVPVGIGNRHTIARSVNKIMPGGNTPLARALQLIRETLIPAHPGARIIVISDGAESCGGDPVGQALALKARGSDIELNIIGLGVARAEADELKRVAEAGGGQYYQVDQHGDFEKAMQDSLAPRKPTPTAPGPETPAGSTLPQKPEQPGASQPGTAQPTAPFVLNNARIVEEDNRKFLVFDYQSAETKDAFMQFYVSNQEGTPAEMKNNALAITGQAAYGTGQRSGTVRLEIPSALRTDRPIFVLGEMWGITEVPEPLYFSEPLRID